MSMMENIFWRYVLIFIIFSYVIMTYLLEPLPGKPLFHVSVFYIMLPITMITLMVGSFCVHSLAVLVINVLILILSTLWYRLITNDPKSCMYFLILNLILLLILMQISYRINPIATMLIGISLVWVLTIIYYIVKNSYEPPSFMENKNDKTFTIP